MSTNIQVDSELLYRQHQHLIEIAERLDNLLVETGPTDGRIFARIRTLAQEALEQLEDVLDSEASRVAMEDVRAHGAVSWDEVDPQSRP